MKLGTALDESIGRSAANDGKQSSDNCDMPHIVLSDNPGQSLSCHRVDEDVRDANVGFPYMLQSSLQC